MASMARLMTQKVAELLVYELTSRRIGLHGMATH